MITVDEALQHYSDSVTPLPIRPVAIDNALHHVLAAAPRTAIDLPPFAQAAVDGYALRTVDVGTATAANPVSLTIDGEIAAGVHDAVPPVPAGACLRVMTGAPLPADCDAVVMQENVHRDADCIVVSAALASGRGVNAKAQELLRGAALGRSGQRITAGLQAALAKAGVGRVEVHRQPVISIIVTGDEVVPVAPRPRDLRPGETYDGNGPLIRSWLSEQGYAVPAVRYVRDDPRHVEREIGRAFETCDLVITNGGTSVGDHDHVRAAAARLGAAPVVRGVAQQPGKPLYFARRDGAWLLGLPGNPGAVVIGLVVHARRILDCLQGVAMPGPVLFPGRLTQSVDTDAVRERLVRARREITLGGVRLTPLPGQASHMMSNLETADTVIRVPAGAGRLAAGTVVDWTPL